MRPSLLPNLIAAAGRNMARGFADLALFEVGQIYGGDRPEDERLSASGVRRGMNGPRHWAGERRSVDLFDAKADALGAADGRRRADRPAADGRRRPSLVSPGPRRRPHARAEEPAGALWGNSSARARGHGRRRPARCLRGRPERGAAAEKRPHLPLRARRIAVPGRHTRFRLRSRERCPGRQDSSTPPRAPTRVWWSPLPSSMSLPAQPSARAGNRLRSR